VEIKEYVISLSGALQVNRNSVCAASKKSAASVLALSEQNGKHAIIRYFCDVLSQQFSGTPVNRVIPIPLQGIEWT
jgi:hypothetical protein